MTPEFRISPPPPAANPSMINYQTYQLGPHDEVVVLELSGRLDQHSTEFLVESLTGWIERGASGIVLDCTDLEQVTSMGLAALIRIHSRIRKVGGHVHLAGVSGLVADALRIVHFDRLFHLYDTVEQASDALLEARSA